MLRSARRSHAVAVLLASILAASPVLAEEEYSIASAAEMDTALEARRARAADGLATVRALLEREDVRQLAGKAGVELRDVSAALTLLEPDELEELAATAALLDASLAGGQAPAVSGGTGSNFPILYVVVLLAIVAVFVFV